MANAKERPRAGDPPKLTEPLPILKELIETERERLKVALRIENERSIVFPETTVIIKDIERLLDKICELENLGSTSKKQTDKYFGDIGKFNA